MENFERMRQQPIRVGGGGGGGDFGAMLAWDRSVAVAGLVATFAIKSRLSSVRRRRRRDVVRDSKIAEEAKKEEDIDIQEEEKNGSLVPAQTSILEETQKPREEPATERPTNAQQKTVPMTNKMKPQDLAATLNETESPVIDKMDLPLTMRDLKVPLKRLRLKPLVRLQAEHKMSILSPIKEGENEGEDASAREVKKNAVWPAEVVEEMSRGLKETKIGHGRDLDLTIVSGLRIKNMRKKKTKKTVGFLAEKAAVACTGKRSGSSTGSMMTLTMLMVFLLVLVFLRFDAMSCSLLNQ